MSEPFLGEIRMFAGNFAPLNWALCNGQLLPISQNTALFSLLGTYYGGNGKTNFQLPDLQAAGPVCVGTGAGLSERVVGEIGGATSITLTTAEMPSHTHSVGSGAKANAGTPINNVWAATPGPTPRDPGPNVYTDDTTVTNYVKMDPAMVLPAGAVPQSHENMAPYLAVSFIIAMQGIFPQRP